MTIKSPQSFQRFVFRRAEKPHRHKASMQASRKQLGMCECVCAAAATGRNQRICRKGWTSPAAELAASQSRGVLTLLTVQHHERSSISGAGGFNRVSAARGDAFLPRDQNRGNGVRLKLVPKLKSQRLLDPAGGEICLQRFFLLF